MTTQIQFVPPRIPFVDLKTGEISRPWEDFLRSLFTIVGGVNGAIDHATLANLDSAVYTHLSAVNATDLTDAGDSALHFHSSDRALGNATGMLAISHIATGTPDGTKFVRDDGTLVTPSGNGINVATMVASTGGTSIDFTGITAGAKSITLMYSGVSTSGTSNYRVQIGDSGGVETSGYLGSGAGIEGTNTATINGTAGFDIPTGSSAASVVHGSLHLSLMDATTNLWDISGALGHSNTNRVAIVSGSKALSGTLDRVRFTTINGTDTYDAGNLNISWE